VGLVAKKTVGEFNRLVREERGKWKIDSVRRNVINRNRARYMAIVSTEKDGRTLDYATSVQVRVCTFMRDSFRSIF
jgi:hypothetical protein